MGLICDKSTGFELIARLNSDSSNVRKRTVVDKVAELTGNTRKYTSDVIELFLSEMIQELGEGNRLEFRGFGVFEVVTRKQKLARNPRTNEELMVPPHKVVRFKMGKEMQKKLNP